MISFSYLNALRTSFITNLRPKIIDTFLDRGNPNYETLCTFKWAGSIFMLARIETIFWADPNHQVSNLSPNYISQLFPWGFRYFRSIQVLGNSIQCVEDYYNLFFCFGSDFRKTCLRTNDLDNFKNLTESSTYYFKSTLGFLTGRDAKTPLTIL